MVLKRTNLTDRDFDWSLQIRLRSTQHQKTNDRQGSYRILLVPLSTYKTDSLHIQRMQQ
jgi:hypothetical protein